MATFGERLRAVRLAKGWTRYELSKRSGVGEATLSRLENTDRDVTFRTAQLLAAALGVTLDALADPDLKLPPWEPVYRPRKVR